MDAPKCMWKIWWKICTQYTHRETEILKIFQQQAEVDFFFIDKFNKINQFYCFMSHSD